MSARVFSIVIYKNLLYLGNYSPATAYSSTTHRAQPRPAASVISTTAASTAADCSSMSDDSSLTSAMADAMPTTDGERKRRSKCEPVKRVSSVQCSQYSGDRRPSAFTATPAAVAGGGGIADTAATIQRTRKLSPEQLQHQSAFSNERTASATGGAANFPAPVNGGYPFAPFRK